ncbi:hypothetical protein D1B31_13430 [Neobacillus notoginsengisoli]|uniref:Uncharacterized protein n=1 Tax=Neobacillus notoginsengisoli TaxID=1578198 RepID=A0A417YSP2_9BACI|nr:hypothetical protein D1B31_13430 [Neobacillus notoginsengisoli]
MLSTATPKKAASFSQKGRISNNKPLKIAVIIAKNSYTRQPQSKSGFAVPKALESGQPAVKTWFLCRERGGYATINYSN